MNEREDNVNWKRIAVVTGIGAIVGFGAVEVVAIPLEGFRQQETTLLTALAVASTGIAVGPVIAEALEQRNIRKHDLPLN